MSKIGYSTGGGVGPPAALHIDKREFSTKRKDFSQNGTFCVPALFRDNGRQVSARPQIIPTTSVFNIFLKMKGKWYDTGSFMPKRGSRGVNQFYRLTNIFCPRLYMMSFSHLRHSYVTMCATAYPHEAGL